jgi:transcription elongation factor Elf1
MKSELTCPKCGSNTLNITFTKTTIYKATQILGSVLHDEKETKTSTEALASCPICGYEFKESIES